MKKMILFCMLLFMVTMLLAQSPAAFKYQAVARDASGAVLADKMVGFRISILQGSASGSAVYTEQHHSVTNEFGLVNLEIGRGSSITGSIGAINWAGAEYFIKVEMDPNGGNAFQVMGTSQLLSVPYALHAKTVENDTWGTQYAIADATLSGNGTGSFPLGLARQGASTGQILKWNGTTWGPSEDATGSGGLTLPYNGSASYNSAGDALFTVANNGTGTANAIMGKTISNQGGKGVVGWATSENGTCYGVYGETYSPAGWGTYGGGPMIGVLGSAINSTLPNFGVKGVSDSNQGTGVYGLAGASSGTTYGVRGKANSNSGFGIYGDAPNYGVWGQSTSSSGTAIGTAGITASANGYAIWGHATHASGATIGVFGEIESPNGFSGFFSGGKFYVSGRAGFGIQAASAGIHLKGSGFPDSFIYLESAAGQDAGLRLYEGSTAKWHIFNSSGAGGLQIYNSGTVTAIFCKQDNSNVGIGTTTPAYKLQVGNAGDGTQARANAWNLLSDARLKKDFQVIKNPLGMVQKINGYYFHWNTGIDQSRQVGFSAQEVREILPELVSEGEDGYLSIEYGKMAPLLLEAIKELKAENDLLKERLEKVEHLLIEEAKR